MYTIDELQVRLLSELREIAEELDLKNYKKLNKTDLIYKILDQQAVLPEDKLPQKKGAPATVAEENSPSSTEETTPDRNPNERKRREDLPARARKRVNVTEVDGDDHASNASKPSADALMESFNVEVEGGKEKEKTARQDDRLGKHSRDVGKDKGNDNDQGGNGKQHRPSNEHRSAGGGDKQNRRDHRNDDRPNDDRRSDDRDRDRTPALPSRRAKITAVTRA